VIGTRYTVLEAAGGVSGTYTFNDIKLSNFISVIDTYDPTHVYLDVSKSKSFASASLTPNQIATAGGADSLVNLHLVSLQSFQILLDLNAQRANERKALV